MLRRLYDQVLSWAASRNALTLLWVCSTIDAIFFPIPPLVMLVPMMLAKPKESFHFAFAATAGSIIGGLMAYGLGFLFYDQLAGPVIALLGGDIQFACLKASYEQYGFVAVLIWGFMPVPYKIITWASGFFHMPLFYFLSASILGRSLRYFSIAALFYFFGPRAKQILDKHFNLVTIIVGLLIILAIIIFANYGGRSLLPSTCSALPRL
ncbi:MAG: DedA family protein [Alphaproteobacteria bacterium]|nr:DedA family protein [Alphaproteobacteria bacterium]